LSVGRPSPDDLDAAEALKANLGERLTIVRGRAEKWLAGITALTGLLTTVLVVKGPQSVRDLGLNWRIAVGALVLAALSALIYATVQAYWSAYGSPTELNEVMPSPVTGLAERLLTVRQAVAKDAQQQFRKALKATVAGTAALAIAVGITWFAPTATSPGNRTCLSQGGEVISELSAGATAKMTEAGTSIGPCPKTSG
jgi:hypothetical protein